MGKTTPCLWFDTQAEEAANFYTSIFKNSRIKQITHYGEFAAQIGKSKGQVMTVLFELNGQEFMGLNGGPNFKFSEAISFMVNCDDQEELDYFWDKLGQGGRPVECGWIQDKFGLSWQIVPKILPELMSDPEKTERVMVEVMQMVKLDIETLKRAAAGK